MSDTITSCAKFQIFDLETPFVAKVIPNTGGFCFLCKICAKFAGTAEKGRKLETVPAFDVRRQCK
jgi:hypothetical protein